MVEHEDKGWFPLVSTSNKVVYFSSEGRTRRMTLGKLKGVHIVEDVEEAEFTETPDNPEPEYIAEKEEEESAADNAAFGMDSEFSPEGGFFDNDFAMAADSERTPENHFE
jgi:hypothetical protein